MMLARSRCARFLAAATPLASFPSAPLRGGRAACSARRRPRFFCSAGTAFSSRKSAGRARPCGRSSGREGRRARGLVRGGERGVEVMAGLCDFVEHKVKAQSAVGRAAASVNDLLSRAARRL